MAEHYVNLQKLCRICGGRRNKGRPYHSEPLEGRIKAAWGIDIAEDQCEVHPKYLCYNCHAYLAGKEGALGVTPTDWKGHHDEDDCWVCDIKSFAVPIKPPPKRRRSDNKTTTCPKKETGSVKLKDVNEHILCTICNGYMIHAATVTECLHSFCKTCIVKHLQTKHTCPQCKILIHETSPLLNIGFDLTLQNIINKMVPGIEERETRNLNEFYANRGLSVPQNGSSSRPITPAKPETEVVTDKPPDDGKTWFHPNDIRISLAIEPALKDLKQMPMKYIRCSMQLQVGHLTKFIKQKTQILGDIQLICNKKTLSCSTQTLENIWIETWKAKEAPMRLYYSIKK